MTTGLPPAPSPRRALAQRLSANPRDAAAWAELSRLERRRGDLRTARLCAEAAVSLAPEDPAARLARAEALLRFAEGTQRGRHDLAELSASAGPLARRAAALLRALGG